MANQISRPAVTPAGVQLLAGSLISIQNEPDLSRLGRSSENQALSRSLQNISVDNVDLSDTVARTQIGQLLDIICRRLNLMTRMGELKFARQVEPFDPDQEARVLEKSIDIALSMGLPEDQVISFIQMQMDIAKEIQAAVINTLATKRNIQTDPHTQEEKDQAEEEQGQLRGAIGMLLRPLLKALQPLSGSLGSRGVQAEISRQLNQLVPEGIWANSVIQQKIKDSLSSQPAEPLSH